METVLYNISQIVGISILHSLWQGIIIYVALRIVYAAIPPMPAQRKYNIALFALAAVSFWFFYTLCRETAHFNWNGSSSSSELRFQVPGFRSNEYSGYSLLNSISVYMPYIFVAYLAGIAINLLKLNRKWGHLRELKKSLLPAGQMQQYIDRLAQKLQIGKHIRIHFSEQIDVPCVLGWLKPVIILPATLSVHLSACEIKAILLHELAHIRRNDYLVNLLQQIISVILFFNPFIYLISRIISRERENCCDDAVVGRTGDPLIYAQALLKLEQTRSSRYDLALAATGNNFHLLNRIERIMKTQKQPGNIRHLFIGILLLALSAGSLAWFNPAEAGKPQSNHLKTLHRTTDTIVYAALIDTPKSKRKTRSASKMVKDAYVLKKKHRRQISLQDSIHFDSLAAFYDSKAWKQQMEIINKEGDKIRKQFDNPQWKKQMEAIKAQTLAMQKQFNSPEWKSQMDAIKKQSEQMGKQFDSPEWKKQMEAIKLQTLAMQKQFDSPEWKSRMDAIKKQSEEMRKQFDSPEWKKQMEAMKLQAQAMQKQFDSPQWKKQMQDLKTMTEKMQQQFNSPEWKKQMEDLQKSSTQWRKMWQDKMLMRQDSTANSRSDKAQQDTAAWKVRH